MKRLVFFPSDPIKTYIEYGRTYDYLDNYYNPGGFFDEVFCLSPWGDKNYETISKIHYIKAKPEHFSKIIKRIKPDVVRGYGGYCCADWVSISKVKDIPTVISVHDTNPELIHDSIRYADEIICMSESVKKAVTKFVKDIDASKIFVLPNRVDVEIFSKKYDEKYFKKLNEKFGVGKHVLHVGRKTEQKNIDTLIKALNFLSKDVSVIFVGGRDAEKYKQMAVSEEVADRCFFLGSVNKNELPMWYSWCDCFCTPSRWEGFGLVFIEAAACEALVITSNIGPMNEYLTNRKNSILVDDFENPKEIAKAIEFSLSDENKNLIGEMKKNARQVGLAFSKEKIDAQEVALYERAMSLSANNMINKQLLKTIRSAKMHSRLKCISSKLVKFGLILIKKFFG